MRGKTIVMAAAAMALLPAAVDAAAAQPVPQGEPRLIGSARDRAVQCMAQAISYEAGHEPEPGQSAVAQVILNRLKDPAYPKTVCGVVYQGSRRRTGCQFTFTCDGSLARWKPGSVWPAAVRIATLAIDGGLSPTVGGALNYHADYVQPYWAAHLVRVGQIGAHIFYRPGSGSNAARVTTTATAPRNVRLTVWGLTAATLTSVGGTVAVQRY